MEEKVMETIVTSFIKELISQSKSFITEANQEVTQFLGIKLKRYLEKQKDKYSYVKTLLKGNTPVYLYDIYYHLKIHNSNDGIIETKSIKMLFLKSNYVTLIGDAGSGKSTLIKHLFLNSISEKYNIPILIELRYLNNYDNSFESYIYERIFENRLSENSTILERLLNAGKFIFFLDGFDELKSDIKVKVISSLNSFINQFEKNKFIITTRPYSDIEHLQEFHNYHIRKLDLNSGEIEGFIHKQLSNEVELALKIVSSIKNNQSQYITSFLSNPLLLTLYILTFQSDASVPTKKYIFYRRVINALFSEHDSKTKLGFVREKVSGLNQEQFEEILKIFSFLSYFESKFSWDSDYIIEKLRIIKAKLKNIAFDNTSFINDLKSAIALWVEDNGIVSFAHRSLQEYFAALFIKHLNEKENERIYTKIIEKFSLIKNQTEVTNFLSLCEEMDTKNYKKFYLLPLLHELRAIIDDSNDLALAKSFLKFFASGLVITTKNFRSESSIHNRDVVINDIVYRSFNIHYPFTQKLFDILTKELNIDRLRECSSEVYYYNDKEIHASSLVKHTAENNELKKIDLTDGMKEDFFNLCYERVLQVAKQLSLFIDNKIKETEKYIREMEIVEKDFVDLI